MSKTPGELAAAILSLTAPQLIELNRILIDGGGEPIGVREPRKPPPESPGDAIAVAHKEETP